MKRLFSLLIAITMSVSLFTALTACGPKKKTITVYATSEDFRIENAQKMLDEKFPEYKIKVEYKSTGELAAKLANEGKKTDCDIVLELENTYLESLGDTVAKLDGLPGVDFDAYLPELVPASHRYVSLRAAELLGRDPAELKVVSCHLGNGSSLAAVKGGRCVDTSMGLTPLAGLPMGTRAGDMDVGVVEFIANKYDMTISEAVNLLNKESGMLGLSGVSSDFRDLEQAAEKENHRATVALEIFEYRVRKMIAEYAAAMGGVDVVVFTAGVGENAPETRAHILHGLEFMGITCDPEKNNCRGKEQIISQDGAPVTVMVVPTNEELMIAQDTMELVLDQE